MDALRSKIAEVMAVVFNIPIAELPGNCSYGVFDRWDSITHMNLIVALEDEFNIIFSDDEVIDLLDIDLICEVIKTKANDGLD